MVYFGIGGYPNAWGFFRFYFVMILLDFTASAFGQMISVMFNQPEAAVQIYPLFILPLLILGGFYTNSGNVPGWIGWLQYVSPVRYGFESVTTNEFSLRPNLDPHNNPVVYLGFFFGYGLAMLLLLIVAIGVRIISLVMLKLRVTKF